MASRIPTRDCFGTVVPRNDRRGVCLAMMVCVAKYSSAKLLKKSKRNRLAVVGTGVKQNEESTIEPVKNHR